MNTAASGDRLHEGDAALAEIGRLMLRSLTDVDMDTMRCTIYSYVDGTVTGGDYSDELCMRLLRYISEDDAEAVRGALSADALRAAAARGVSSPVRYSEWQGEDWIKVESRAFFGGGRARIVCRRVGDAYVSAGTETDERRAEIMDLIGSNYLCAASVHLPDWIVSFIKKPPALEGALGDSAPFDDVVKVYLTLLHPDDDADKTAELFTKERILEEVGEKGACEADTRRLEDGVTRWASWRIVPLPGDPSVLLVRQQDSTALHEAEEARREAELERKSNRSKSLFLANISHEIRTPLNAILGYAELLLTGDPLPAGVHDDVKRISDAGATLLEIVNNILDLSKVESGQFVIRDDLYETKNLVDELSGSVIARIKDKPVNFSAECSDDMPEFLYGDAVLVKQIIMNLLSNAAKYTDKGFITMRMSYADGRLNVQVHDTGMGIRPEDLDRIFEKFERLESNINHNVEGTGLGLPLTKELVEQMGGSVSVESEFGTGSTFSVSLPQGTGTAAPEPEPEAGSISVPGLRVLLVDDNSVNLTVAQRLLRRFELDVDTAVSGEESLEKLRKGKYDWVLMDHMMPGMDGVEALRQLRKLPGLEKQFVIALTANAMKGMQEFFMSNGFDDYMPKPISLESISAMLRKWVPQERIVIREPEKKAEEQLPEALTLCRGIDVQAAMKYSESYSDLMEIISDFNGLIDMKSAQIEDYAASGDTGAYTVEVHALKSSSRLIGALELSKLAERLEQAGRENDAGTISSLTPQLLALYRSYKDGLRPAEEALESGRQTVEISPEELRGQLEALRGMLRDFDLDGAEAWSDTAACYRLGESEDEALRAIRTDIQMIDYLGAIKHVDELLAAI